MNKGLGKGGKGLGGVMKNYRKPLRDNIQGFSKPAIKRLAHRAGVLKIADQVYDEMRTYLKRDVDIVVRSAINFMELDKRKIVMQKDIKRAFEINGVDLLVGVNENTRDVDIKKAVSSDRPQKRTKKDKGDTCSRRFKSGTVALRDIRYQQKHSDTLVIPVAIFRRIVQEMAQEYKDNFKISGVALKLFQMGMEHNMVELLRLGNLCAIHRHTKTLKSKDLQLARAILSARNVMMVCGNRRT